MHGGPLMAVSESSKIGRRGTLVIPASLRRIFGLKEGSSVIAEETADGILIRPAVTLPVERYSSEEKAVFLLNSAVDEDDYTEARKAVESLGLDPDAIPHEKP